MENSQGSTFYRFEFTHSWKWKPQDPNATTNPIIQNSIKNNQKSKARHQRVYKLD